MLMRRAQHHFHIELAMADDRIARRNKLRKTLAELRNTALAELEHRGYEVRGKTPGEIRRLLKRRSSKQKSNVQPAQNAGLPNSSVSQSE